MPDPENTLSEDDRELIAEAVRSEAEGKWEAFMAELANEWGVEVSVIREAVHGKVEGSMQNGEGSEDVNPTPPPLPKGRSENLESRIKNVNPTPPPLPKGRSLSLHLQGRDTPAPLFGGGNRGGGEERIENEIETENLDGAEGWVDYNNEIKNKWRAKAMGFVDKYTPASRRASMRVLCLPGEQCLDIPPLLAMGFTPKNIVGVENGYQADLEVFRKNAGAYGIDYRIGDLDHVLDHEEGPFDVAIVDFHGMVSKKNVRILRKIKMGRRILVLVNFMAKRERTEMTDAYLKLGKIYSREMRDFCSDLLENERDPYSFFVCLNEKIQSQETELPQARNDVMWYVVVNNIALFSRSNHVLEARYRRSEPAKQLGMDLSLFEVHKRIKKSLPFFLSCLDDYLRMCQTVVKPGQIPIMINALSALFTHSFTHEPVVAALEEYRYVSQVGNRIKSPFYSDFLVIDDIHNELSALSHTSNFLFDAVLHTHAGDTTPGSKLGFDFCDRDGKTIFARNINRSSKLRFFVAEGNKFACSVPFFRMIEDINHYLKRCSGGAHGFNYMKDHKERAVIE